MNLQERSLPIVGRCLVMLWLVLGRTAFLEAAPSLISEEEFLRSPAAAHFQDREYEQALAALEILIQRYPEDPLLRRYRAMCLDRLGRSQEAIEIYQKLLAENPDHVPTHYFLGQAYFRMGEQESAEKEWRKVRETAGETPYAEWAGEALSHVAPAPVLPELEVKRWDVLLSSGYEHDSNVVLKPSDKSLATPQDPNANRYTLNSRLGHRLVSKPNFLAEGLYEFSQTLHDDGLDEFNFTFQEFGVDLRRQSRLGNRMINWGFRYGLAPGFLDGDLFSLTNRWLLSADARFSPKTLTLFFTRLALSNFGPDGSAPSQTSRDGFYQDAGATHFWYPWNSAHYFFLHEEFNAAFTRGRNFDRLGNTTRLGTHFAVKRVALDISGGLAFGGYPHFSSLSSLDTDRRRDFTWDLFASITYSLTQHWLIHAFYRYTNSQNPSGFFEYQRHTNGIQLEFSQSF